MLEYYKIAFKHFRMHFDFSYQLLTAAYEWLLSKANDWSLRGECGLSLAYPLPTITDQCDQYLLCGAYNFTNTAINFFRHFLRRVAKEPACMINIINFAGGFWSNVAELKLADHGR